ncbi:hypothetical protein ACWIDW_09960 [Microbacterium sp. NPDC055312]
MAFTLVSILQAFFQGGLGDLVLRTDGRVGGREMRRLEWVSPFAAASSVSGVLLIDFGKQEILGSVLLGVGLAWFFSRLALCRSIFASQNQTWRAVVMNVAFLAGSTASVLAVTLGGATFAESMALVVVGFIVSWLLSIGPIRRWTRSTSESKQAGAIRLGLEAALIGGSAQLANVLVVIPLGLDFAAAMRVASMLLGPANSLLTASRYILFPTFRKASNSQLFGKALRIALSLASLTVLWVALSGTVLALVPDLVAGASASVAQSFFLWFGIGAGLQGFYWGLFLACRSRFLDLAITRGRGVILVSTVGAVAVVMVFPQPWIFFAGMFMGQLGSSLILLLALLRQRRAR